MSNSQDGIQMLISKFSFFYQVILSKQIQQKKKPGTVSSVHDK